MMRDWGASGVACDPGARPNSTLSSAADARKQKATSHLRPPMSASIWTGGLGSDAATSASSGSHSLTVKQPLIHEMTTKKKRHAWEGTGEKQIIGIKNNSKTQRSGDCNINKNIDKPRV